MRKIKMKIALPIFMLILAFALIGCSDNDRAWKDAETKNTVEGFQQFISQNPKSKYENIAKDKIEELVWQSVSQTDDSGKLKEYISTHEDGKYSDKAKEQLESIVWRTSVNENTYDSYQSYLEKYSSGNHAQEAISTLGKIAENESRLIERSLEENILLYFNRKKLSNDIDHVLQLEDIPFQDLKHRMSLLTGGFDIVGGRSAAHPGSLIRAEFLNKQVVVNGIADGRGGFAVITEIVVLNGVTVTTIKSTKYTYSEGKWVRA